MRFVRVGAEGFFQQAGKSDQRLQSGRPTIPALAAANEICAHYFPKASSGCSGGHVNTDPDTEVEPQLRHRLMLSQQFWCTAELAPLCSEVTLTLKLVGAGAARKNKSFDLTSSSRTFFALSFLEEIRIFDV